MKKLVILALFISILMNAGSAFALFSKKNVGTTAFPFLKVAVDARNVGMGEVGAAFTNDANAMYWNVAGLADVKNISVATTYNKWFLNSTQGYIGAAKAMPFGTLGVAINYLYVGNIQGYDVSGTETQKFNYNNMAYTLGYAKKINKLSAGLSMKFINHKLKDFSESGYAVDIGALYKGIIRNVNLGLVIQNLGPKVNNTALPLNIRFGISGLLLKMENLLWAIDLNMPSDNIPNIHLGAQYSLGNIMEFRAGFRSNREDLGTLAGLALGFGANFENYSLDISYSPYTDIASVGGAIRVSAAATF